MSREGLFERSLERAERIAERRARQRRAALAERLRAELPAGVRAEDAPEGALLSGRGLRRRFALDPALRWLAGRIR